MSVKNQIGIIGMGIMGKSLALNLERHGYNVSIFNRSYDKIDHVVSESISKRLIPYYSIKDFILSLERPRCILIMIKSGSSIDQIILSMVPNLDKNDIIIDGGNSFYKDTIRRYFELSKKELNFIGLGISGGEFGALYGPSFMPGGSRYAYDLIEPILKNISAHFDNEPCVSYIGSDGSGHYVKMVHNGIEYADMQLIAEIYSIFKNIFLLSNEELSKIFDEWNKGELNSYLINITKNILTYTDATGNYVIDYILDQSDHKGTGQWVSQDSLELCEPLNMITESVFSRYLSILKSQRVYASKVLLGPSVKNIIFSFHEFIEKARQALYLGKIIAYAQGFSQLRVASEKNNWDLNFANIAKIFRAGCIIRAQFLQHIVDAYVNNPCIFNLLLTPYFVNIANSYQESLRDVILCAIMNGIPVPVLSAAIGYYDSYRSSVLPANLIQAQRDYFGAHMYKRVDKKGLFHTLWTEK